MQYIYIYGAIQWCARHAVGARTSFPRMKIRRIFYFHVAVACCPEFSDSMKQWTACFVHVHSALIHSTPMAIDLTILTCIRNRDSCQLKFGHIANAITIHIESLLTKFVILYGRIWFGGFISLAYPSWIPAYALEII